ncbi:MAG: PepSY domain-containing protein [Clostridia bacterium]|nr:PepSY domain-containing protein [Clostridia bacterium]
MKKLLMLLAALLLAVAPVLAEDAEMPAVPVEILPQTEGLMYMADAIAAAKATLPVLPADCLTRAELVRMSDGSHQWIVTVFDLGNFADGWCIAVDAVSGEVLMTDATTIGYFDTVSARWQVVKGPEALWSLEDKLLFDTLYTMQPTYGLPMDGDMSQGEALVKAMAAVGVTAVEDYDIGYGYIMGAGDANGVWEVWFMNGDEMIYKVNLDAVTGQIYLIEPDEEGNG